MLILTRGVGEKLVIGNGEIVVSIERIAGDVVRIGIQAPQTTPIMRQEILAPPPAGVVVDKQSPQPPH
ncbi:MAG TPA: carbon storage regulator [Pirellulaceae bacterium]|nr:carbon storage regulator [Pirellulaceae bacterium]